MLNVGLIGFGGIAKSHRTALAKLKISGKAKLTCAFDVRADAFTENTLDFSLVAPEYEENINFYTDLEELIKKEDVNLLFKSYFRIRLRIQSRLRLHHLLRLL